MRWITVPLAAWLLAGVGGFGLTQARSQELSAEESREGFVSLFNGKDLTGWRFGNDVLDGKTEASDGRFKVENGTIVITGATKPGQAKMEAIDTLAPFTGDFILRLEFRASRDANSGLPP
jgi:hypothetical protein